MKVHKITTLTLAFYSRLHHHHNEIALAAAYHAPFSFSITIGEWSWHFGIGSEDDLGLNWYGPYLSYTMTINDDRGYFSAGVSSHWTWYSA